MAVRVNEMTAIHVEFIEIQKLTFHPRTIAATGGTDCTEKIEGVKNDTFNPNKR